MCMEYSDVSLCKMGTMFKYTIFVYVIPQIEQLSFLPYCDLKFDKMGVFFTTNIMYENSSKEKIRHAKFSPF